jgi:hypothetical protein
MMTWLRADEPLWSATAAFGVDPRGDPAVTYVWTRRSEK